MAEVIADVLDIAQPRAENFRAYDAETVLAEKALIISRRTNIAAPVHPAQEVVQQPPAEI
jgi:hypothetical protein